MTLTLVEEFLNTLDERTFTVHGEKHVPSDSLEAWLTAQGTPHTPEDLVTAGNLRTTLRTTLMGDGENHALAAFPLRLTPAGGQLRMKADTGVPGLDAVVETVATSVAAGTWKRLKLCASDDCRWAFYDTSRSGGGRWCDMNVCGNRHKTRAYRTRRAG